GKVSGRACSPLRFAIHLAIVYNRNGFPRHPMRTPKALAVVVSALAVGSAAPRTIRAQEMPGPGGPRVSVFTTLTSFSAARRVQPTFHVDEDSYVLVGHMGADGVVRILFPTSP